MPVKSKAQLRFMHAIMNGSVRKAGLSAENASEFLKDVPKKLPERVKKGKKK